MTTSSLKPISSNLSFPYISLKIALRTILDILKNLVASVISRQRNIAELRVLLSADDAVLKDIGVTRSDVRIMLRNIGADAGMNRIPHRDQLGQRS